MRRACVRPAAAAERAAADCAAAALAFAYRRRAPDAPFLEPRRRACAGCKAPSDVAHLPRAQSSQATSRERVTNSALATTSSSESRARLALVSCAFAIAGASSVGADSSAEAGAIVGAGMGDVSVGVDENGRECRRGNGCG
jgi:hypothetical protein